MDSMKQIVVGIDLVPGGVELTPGSHRAIDQALWIAERTGAAVTFVHSTAHDRYLDPIGMNTVLVGEGPSEEAMDQIFELVNGAVERGIECDVVLDDRRAGEALPDRADRAGADLLVLGKRSRAERDGRRLGRVSKQLVRASTTPLWIVGEEHVGPVERIVAATDFSAVGNHAVAGAASLASAFEAELHVVHAVPLEFLPSAAYGTEGFATRAEVEQSARIQGARERLEELCRTLDCGAKPCVLDRPPYDALRDFVAEKEARLLVLGTASRRGLTGFLIGHTAEWLIDSVDASLLAFPPASVPGARATAP